MSSVDQTTVFWPSFVTIKACPHSPVMQRLHRALITCMLTVTRFSPFQTIPTQSLHARIQKGGIRPSPLPRKIQIYYTHIIQLPKQGLETPLPRQTQLSLGTPFPAEQFSGSALMFSHNSTVNRLARKRSFLRSIGFEINDYFDEFKGLIFIFLRNSEIFK